MYAFTLILIPIPTTIPNPDIVLVEFPKKKWH